MPNRILIVAVLITAGAGVAGYLFSKTLPATPVIGATFAGASTDLESTRILATLDAPLEPGRNAIWCASFTAAWKTLETSVVQEPIALDGSPEIVAALNAAPDPRAFVPAENLYTAAGWNDKGIVAQIIGDLAEQFPGKVPPEFPDIESDSFVAYAYLEAGIQFSIPYFQNDEPLMFTDSAGRGTAINSFGIRRKDDYAYYELRRQPKILFASRDDRYHLIECIVDLDQTTTGDQIVLARIGVEDTLELTLQKVEEKIAEAREQQVEKQNQWHDDINAFIPNDVLLVPDMVWDISHHFAELEGQTFSNAALKSQRIDVAQQDIRFSLSRSGAELRSEAKVYYLPIPTRYVFDRPFLLYMKKRGETSPYFVMWVDNAELLSKWPTDE